MQVVANGKDYCISCFFFCVICTCSLGQNLPIQLRVEAVVENYLKVGTSVENAGNAVYSDLSNYGQEEVDIFAPGQWVASAYSREYYLPYASGTSYASALTSGAAALIRSLFPQLTAKETKKLLMDSGIPIEAEVTLVDGTNIPFSKLSKSGKILNAYNAVKMAIAYSK